MRLGRVQRCVDHVGDRLRAAEDVDCLGPPRRALLGDGAGRVLGLAGLQRGALRQVVALHHRRRPAMVVLERGRELTAPLFDRSAPRRPALVQLGRHPDHLTHWTLPVAHGAVLEPQPVRFEALVEGGVVGLGGRDDALVEEPGVDRQPLARPGGADLVRHRHMRVEVRIAGAGVTVGERRTDQPVDVDLPHPLRALAGVEQVVLDEPQRLGHRVVVGAFDHRRGREVGDRPQRGHALWRREGQVETGHHRSPWARVPRHRTCQLPRIEVGAAHLPDEELGRHLAADPGPHLTRHPGIRFMPVAGVPLRHATSHLDAEVRHLRRHLERRPQPVGRQQLTLRRINPQHSGPLVPQRVLPSPEQQLHLLSRHLGTGEVVADRCAAPAHPRPRGFAVLGVVRRQALVALFRRILHGHLPGQVVISRPGRQLVQRHRHMGSSRSGLPGGNEWSSPRGAVTHAARGRAAHQLRHPTGRPSNGPPTSPWAPGPTIGPASGTRAARARPGTSSGTPSRLSTRLTLSWSAGQAPSLDPALTVAVAPGGQHRSVPSHRQCVQRTSGDRDHVGPVAGLTLSMAVGPC